MEILTISGIVYQNELSEAKDIIDKQITTNMSFEDKMNIIMNSCTFVGLDGNKLCHKELLDYIENNTHQ